MGLIRSSHTTVPNYRMERAACIKMFVFEVLSCLIFLFYPNPVAFSLLAANGFSIQPSMLSALNFIGALVYFYLSDTSNTESITLPIRRAIFFLASLPLMIYIVPLGLISLTLTGSVAGLSFIAVYVVILLVITAIFQGYSKRLEVVTLLGMAAFMWLTAYSLTKTTPDFFIKTKFPIGIVVWMALLGGASYVVMLTPQAKALPVWIKRVWFIGSEAVIPVYASVMVTSYLLFGGGVLFPPLALYDFYLLIALLPYAIFRDSYA